jgi:N-acetyl-anhydromuramyl-L-alanine amidase AmpD
MSDIESSGEQAAPDSDAPINSNIDAQLQSSDFKIVWKGSPNFWSGRDKAAPIAICNHIMDGTMESTDGWFKNRRSDVSSHFGVARDGRIWQWVKVEDTAWANGILQNPDTSIGWLADCVRNKANPNNFTVSIEHEGRSGVPFTEVQYKATLWLQTYLCRTYKIAADTQHIIGHYQITARDRANCPGSAFPWARLRSDLTNALSTGTDTGTGSGSGNSGSRWTDGVPGVVLRDLGSGTVNSNNSYVRSRPSLSGQPNNLLRTLSRGTTLSFSGYTDAGSSFKGSTRWYLISDSQGGGWIHSVMINLAKKLS